MEPKKLEPMPLDELRERLRFTAQSAVSTLEPIDVARMRLTVEALVAVFAEAILERHLAWPRLKKVASEVV